MKALIKSIIGIALLCIILAVVFLLKDWQQSIGPSVGSLSLRGWLFEIEVNGQSKFYMVVTETRIYKAGEVITGGQIEEKIGQAILPIDIKTGLIVGEIQDLKTKTEERIRKVWFDEDEIEEVKEPILQFRKKSGGGTEPRDYVVPAVGKNNYYLVRYNPNTAEFEGSSKLFKQNIETETFFRLLISDEAEIIMENYLSDNNIEGVIKKKYLVLYTFVRGVIPIENRSEIPEEPFDIPKR